MVLATSQQEFSDADFRVVAKADQSKKLQFDVSALAANTTSTWNVLADPNADRILFWDDSAGAYAWLTPGTGLTITTTTIDASSNSMTLLGTLTTTSGSSQSLTGIAAGYRQLYCELDGVSMSNAGNALQCALSSTNGAAYGTAATVMTPAGPGSTIDGWMLIGGISSTLAAAKSAICMPKDSAGSLTPADIALPTNTAAVVDAIRFSSSANSFDAGTIRIYGVK